MIRSLNSRSHLQSLHFQIRHFIIITELPIEGHFFPQMMLLGLLSIV